MFKERLRELIDLKCDGKQIEISKNTNISHSTISSYYTRNSSPSMEQLIQLADFFNVSVDYLLGRENDFGAITTTSPTLTKTQSELLSVFNLLSEDDQHQVIGFAKALAY